MGRAFIRGVVCFLGVAAIVAAEPLEMPGVSGLHVRAADGLRFSPDGRWLFAAMGTGTNADRIVVWDMATHGKVAELPSPAGSIYSFAVSPKRGMLATGHADSIYLWDREGDEPWQTVVPVELIGDATAKRLRERSDLRARARRVHAISFSPNEESLAWSWVDKSIRLWDLKAGKESSSLPIDLPSTAYGGNLHFVSERQLLVMGIKSKTGRGHEIQLWNVDATLSDSLQIPRGGMSSNADVRPDGRALAVLVSSAGGRVSKPTELWIWNLRDGKARKVGSGPLPEMFGPRFSADGELVAVGMYANHRIAQGRILVVDVAGQRRTRRVLPMTRGGACPAHLDFSPHGDYLVAAVYFDRAPVQLWPLTTSPSESAHGRSAEQ